jgi:hypothetical protein
MPDITMCTNDHCPVKDTCRRSHSGTKPNEGRQSWSTWAWTNVEGCDAYWQVKHEVPVIK